MTSEDKFPNAHPVKEYLDKEGLWWSLRQVIGFKGSEDRLKRFMNGIEPMPHRIKQEADWFYNTFCNEKSPMYRHKNNED